jgi:protein required for attachment to host cells
MRKKARRTWVLVADSSHAKLYRMDGLEPPRLMRELFHPAAREHERDLRGNRPNAIQDRDEEVTHAHWSPGSPQIQETERFVGELTDILEKARNEHLFDDLVLVAAPQLLGMLRARFSRPLALRVVKEEPKRRVDERPEVLLEELYPR